MALSVHDSVAQEPPKKRRRRVPTSGAAEDCFGCRKRGIQCDRRRPYCSQCLEKSSDCPGYRTTLTWGVGVASRGKLRGLSLPVANSAPSAPPQSPSSSTSPSAGTKPGPFRPRANTFHDNYSNITGDDSEESRRKRVRLTPIRTDHRHATPHPAASAAVPFTNPFQPGSLQHAPDWQGQSMYAHRPSFSTPDAFYRQRDLFPLHTAMGTSFPSVPWASTPVSIQPRSSAASTATSDSSMASFPHTPSVSQSFDPYFPSLAAASAAPHSASLGGPPLPFTWHHSSPTPSSPDQRPSMASHGSDLARFEHDEEQKLSSEPEPEPSSATSLAPTSGDSAFRPSLHRAYSAPQFYHADDRSHTDDEYSVRDDSSAQGFVSTKPQSLAADDWFSSMSLELSPAFFQLHPRMQYLLNYYDQAICPVLVAYDGPSNPYREHIMRLAVTSPGLQSAIAALTTNNLRMRRLKEIPRSRIDQLPDKDMISATIGLPDAEEQHYKLKSIDYLNSQLSDPAKAREDSVLATLLILCLFHVCDSGFSKFKTQLAGVQKLLKMRGGFRQSEFVAWVEMFFAWFDVMTSAVNDRETLLHGGSLDILNLSRSLRDVEQFSGCDGRLFKLIARLSRLNLLSQSRPVRDVRDPSESAKVPPAKDFYSLPREDFEVKDYFFKGEPDPIGTSPPPLATSPAMSLDARRDFWAEWHNIRDRLTAWTPAPVDPADTSPEATSPRARHDMQHMSESFRAAALLYTERLAHPAAPCGSPHIQAHVDATLAHVRAIGEGSCVTKFLLWPIFIAGTEAVTPAQRSLIRARCEEILRESGFYNNVSGLEVLERIWAEGRDPGHPPGEQAFRWRKCMERVDGEYIVI